MRIASRPSPRRHVLASAVLPLALVFSVVGAPAQQRSEVTPVGEWAQYDDRKGDLRSIVRIEQAGDELTGTVVKVHLRAGEPANPTCEKCAPPLKDAPIEGLRIMWGLRGAERHWDGGRILDPENGKVYRVKLTVSEDGRTLDVRGYLGFSLLGRTQHWKRVEPSGNTPSRQ